MTSAAPRPLILATRAVFPDVLARLRQHVDVEDNPADTNYAALAVFEREPKLNPALLTLPNVVLTPHIASANMVTRHAMASLAADNLIAMPTGGVPPRPINPEVLLRLSA